MEPLLRSSLCLSIVRSTKGEVTWLFFYFLFTQLYGLNFIE
ncbi:hypothetical protein B4110_3168 [Parageobacillus toebii]|uniref:Uncharacterized protein n=1 Tax=Parageobacillus toebii TaxID=153151 RepID=A0A150MFV4_9BACL|nr:hypothetical protein B4110_3168 [Parageobacillus toebii]